MVKWCNCLLGEPVPSSQDWRVSRGLSAGDQKKHRLSGNKIDEAIAAVARVDNHIKSSVAL